MLTFLKTWLQRLEKQTGLNKNAFVGLCCAFLLTAALWLLAFEWMKARQRETNTLQALILPSETELSHPLTKLPHLAPAPNFMQLTNWIHSAPLTLKELQGKVVLVNFWTYSCVHCMRALPYLKEWDAKYRKEGLVILGIHTPDFAFEYDPQHVVQEVLRSGLHYPIALDNSHATWKLFGNQIKPAFYLIDQTGMIRSFHRGEGNYVETENAIRMLLNHPPLQTASSFQTTHTTQRIYLGSVKAANYTPTNTLQHEKEAFYAYQGSLGKDQVGLRGYWKILDDKITSMSDSSFIDLHFLASDLYAIMQSERKENIPLFLDHQRCTTPMPTDDTTSGNLVAHEPRRYHLLSLRQRPASWHILTLHVPKGVSLHAFILSKD